MTLGTRAAGRFARWLRSQRRKRSPRRDSTYAAAGVDIDAADQAVEAMRDLVASTATGRR